ncbi:DNA methylase [compost metagenome]
MEVTLEIKKYIQPFERLLALEELRGLTHLDINDLLLNDETCNSLTITTDISLELLKYRLAYWERVGCSDLYPTQQVLLESSQDVSYEQEQLDLFGNPPVKLPQSRKLRYGPHDIHEYRGKFFPQLVKALINKSGLSEGCIVFDPFSGSGTTACEARLLGMETIGVDLNPLSVKISRIKTAILEINPKVIEEEFAALSERILNTNITSEDINERWDSADLKYLEDWFDQCALQDVAQILKAINNCNEPIVKELFELCLSNIIRSVSWQKESDLRVRKEIVEYIAGSALTLFSEEAKRQIKKLYTYLNIVQSNTNFKRYDIREGDTKNVVQHFPDKVGKCDVLITSPPYATALPYLDTDRLSLIILGLLSRKDYRSKDSLMIGNREVSESKRRELWEVYQERKSELTTSVCELIDKIAQFNHGDNVGFRRRNLPALLAKYFLDISDSMKSALKMMKPNSYAYYVVGNNSTIVDGVKWEIPTDQLLWELGEKVGWSQEKFLNMDLLPSRDLFRKNRGTAESILVFRAKG